MSDRIITYEEIMDMKPVILGKHNEWFQQNNLVRHVREWLGERPLLFWHSRPLEAITADDVATMLEERTVDAIHEVHQEPNGQTYISVTVNNKQRPAGA